MSRHRDLRGTLKSISSSRDLEEMDEDDDYYEEEEEYYDEGENGNGWKNQRDDADLVRDCLEEFWRRFGRDTFSRDQIVAALRRAHYDVEQAMSELTTTSQSQSQQQKAKTETLKNKDSKNKNKKKQKKDEDYDEDEDGYYEDEYDEYDEFGRHIRYSQQQASSKSKSGPAPGNKKPQAPSASPAKKQPAQSQAQALTQAQKMQDKPAPSTAAKVAQSQPQVPFAFDTPSPDDAVLAARGATIKKELEVSPAAPATPPTKAFVPIVKKPDMRGKQKSKSETPKTQKAQAPSSASQQQQQSQPQKDQLVLDLESMGLAADAVETVQREESSINTTEEVELKPLRRTPSTLSLPRSASNADLRSYKSPVIPPQKKDDKERLNIVVVGHVDAGKSTLMGHLLHLLGKVGDQEMRKFEKESKDMKKGSFMYAWVMDASQLERQRGITIDVSTTNFETDKKRVTILDAPGHKDFVPNMISGAAQADVAILVVDSSRGEFEAGFQSGGQTKEHVILVRSLGVTQLLVAVNKLDSVGWSENRFKEIKAALLPFLRQTGFKEKDIAFVPCSGLSGENLISVSEENTALRAWYPSGSPTIKSIIDSVRPATRITDKPLRMCISDIFKAPSKGGICVAGKLESGATVVQQKVVCMPQNQVVTIKYIERDGESVDAAYAGENIVLGLDLGGLDANMLSIGNVICPLESPIPVTKVIKTNLVTFDIKVPITKGQEVVFFSQCAQVSGTITRLVKTVDKATGETLKKKPRCLLKNSAALVKIKTDVPVCVELYNNLKAFGRFTLRAEGNTIASGIITKIYKKRPPNVPKKNQHIRRHTAM